ncbi:MAG: hypothetical protein ACE5OW_06000 [Candidatus Bathyarchaeia archaeon]
MVNELPFERLRRGTINYRVDKGLREMAERLKEFPEFVVERKEGK